MSEHKMPPCLYNHCAGINPEAVPEMMRLVATLADEVEAWVNNHYPGQIHPALRAKYERDMAVVVEARATLVKAKREGGNRMNERNMISECWNCTHRHEVPGDAHIRCNNPDSEMTGNPHGIRNGWFFYPMCFDPTWKTKPCSNYKAEAKEGRDA